MVGITEVEKFKSQLLKNGCKGMKRQMKKKD
jgi:hypothetical protein